MNILKKGERIYKRNLFCRKMLCSFVAIIIGFTMASLGTSIFYKPELSSLLFLSFIFSLIVFYKIRYRQYTINKNILPVSFNGHKFFRTLDEMYIGILEQAVYLIVTNKNFDIENIKLSLERFTALCTIGYKNKNDNLIVNESLDNYKYKRMYLEKAFKSISDCEEKLKLLHTIESKY